MTDVVVFLGWTVSAGYTINEINYLIKTLLILSPSGQDKHLKRIFYFSCH